MIKINVKELTEDKEILNSCRITVWKSALEKQPSETFLDKIFMSEHSPIRDKFYSIEITNIEYWLAMHFVRHHVGVTPYVSTQRDDRIALDKPRDERGQGELVNMRLTLNAQSLIDISRKRLCGKAHLKARTLWNRIIKNYINELTPSLASKCVPNCVYRGFCPEESRCDINWDALKKMRKNYLNGRECL